MAEVNVNDILSKIVESRKKFSFPILVPSLGKEVPFFQFTTEQQKMFIKASMSDMDSYSNTMYALFSIIQNNCADKEIDVTKFTILDKLLISIALRMVSVGATYKVVVNDIKDDEGNGLIANINLDSLCTKILKKHGTTNYNETISVKGTDISVNIGLPTIGTEVSMEHDLEQDARKRAQSDDKNIASSALGELYIYELIKYVKSIKFGDGDTAETVDLESIPSEEKRKIIESLPSNLTAKTIEKVNKIVEDISKISMLELTHEGKKHKYTIDLANPDFFIGS